MPPISSPSTLTRRQCLVAASALPLGAVWRRAHAAAGPALVWRATSRLGYGPTPVLIEAVQSQGASAWALAQLDAAAQAARQNPQVADEHAQAFAPLPTLMDKARREREARKTAAPDKGDGPRPPQPGKQERLRLVDDPAHFSRTVTLQAGAWRLRSASEPDMEVPLLARLTEFWFNHFNVNAGKGAVRPFVGHYLHTLRRHALGRFEDLVLASARHPAMLHYLDQWQSVADGTRAREGKHRGLNENYARELLELHTLGVDGGYSQTDVRELARILTGWTIDARADSGFRFVARAHDSGAKTLLGRRFGARGEEEGEQAIRMLARMPQTARRISRRLCRFFVSDNPPPALEQRLAQVFLDTQGDLLAVLRALLQDGTLWQAQHTLFKTPMDFALSALTVTGASRDPRMLLRSAAYLQQAGQPLFGWPTPDGYAFDAATWRTGEALTLRADHALALGRDWDARFVLPLLGNATQSTIAQEASAAQTGLVLASPDFQHK
ncbi:MAG: DUF1800 domain-containing protein [Rhodoferax sp.]